MRLWQGAYSFNWNTLFDGDDGQDRVFDAEFGNG
jgi:hypothetical protein